MAENEIGDQVIATGIAHGACEACLQHKLEKRKLNVPNTSPAPLKRDDLLLDARYGTDLLVENLGWST